MHRCLLRCHMRPFKEGDMQDSFADYGGSPCFLLVNFLHLGLTKWANGGPMESLTSQKKTTLKFAKTHIGYIVKGVW